MEMSFQADKSLIELLKTKKDIYVVYFILLSNLNYNCAKNKKNYENYNFVYLVLLFDLELDHLSH